MLSGAPLHVLFIYITISGFILLLVADFLHTVSLTIWVPLAMIPKREELQEIQCGGTIQ
jgi:hypothetical protein